MKEFSELSLNIQRMIIYAANVHEFYDMKQSIIKDTENRLIDGKSFVSQITLAQSEPIYDLVNKLAKKVGNVEGDLVSISDKRKMRDYLAWNIINEAKENLGIN